MRFVIRVNIGFAFPLRYDAVFQKYFGNIRMQIRQLKYKKLPDGKIYFHCSELKQSIIMADILKKKIDIMLVNDQRIFHDIEIAGLSQKDICSYSRRFLGDEAGNLPKLVNNVQCQNAEDAWVAQLFYDSFLPNNKKMKPVEVVSEANKQVVILRRRSKL